MVSTMLDVPALQYTSVPSPAPAGDRLPRGAGIGAIDGVAGVTTTARPIPTDSDSEISRIRQDFRPCAQIDVLR